MRRFIGALHGTFPFPVRKTVAFSPPVKIPETPAPKPSGRSYIPHVVDPLAPSGEHDEKFQPRYVEVPALREHGFGRRNLVWGVVILVLALLLLVAAVIVAGQKAVLSLSACLFTFAALFVLARLHVFRQRNGGFLAIGVVVLLGAIIPLLDRGYETLAGISQPAAAVSAAPAPRPVDTEPPLLTESFALAKPDATQPQVKVIKDSRVVIGEKPFIIKTGDVFPLIEAKGGEATFSVRDLHVSLPMAVVEILGGKPGRESSAKEATPKETRESAMAAALAAVRAAEAPKAEPAASPAPAPKADGVTSDLVAVTRSAQMEAMRRYPALAVKDSMENEIFITTYRQLRESGNTDFFLNPEWPLELAEKLAAQHGWARGDRPSPVVQEDPASSLEPPSGDSAPMEPAPAGNAPRTPQLPPGGDEPPQVPRR